MKKTTIIFLVILSSINTIFASNKQHASAIPQETESDTKNIVITNQKGGNMTINLSQTVIHSNSSSSSSPITENKTQLDIKGGDTKVDTDTKVKAESDLANTLDTKNEIDSTNQTATSNVSALDNTIEATNTTETTNQTAAENKSENKTDNTTEYQPTHTQEQEHILTNTNTQKLRTTFQKQSTYQKQAILKTYIFPIAICCAASYSICLATTYRMKKLIENKDAWCNWKYDAILYDSKKMVMQELIEAIETKNINPARPTDHISPMMQFLKEIDHEQAIIRHYLFTMKIAYAIYMNKILPGNDMRELAKQKMDRLDVLKKLFFDWAQSQRSRKISQLVGAH